MISSVDRPRRILAVSGSRADYGLVNEVWRNLREEPSVDLGVVLTGTHGTAVGGWSEREVLDDGFSPLAIVPMAPLGDDGPAISKACALAVPPLREVVGSFQPDIVLLAGDRYEILTLAWMTFTMGIPIAHMYGGEETLGARDNKMRHAISQLSSLHFVTAQAYADRLALMGISRDRLYVVGAPALSTLRRRKLPSAHAVAKSFGLELSEPYVVLTLHPETSGPRDNEQLVRSTVEALSREDSYAVLLSGVNADWENQQVASLLKNFAEREPERVSLVTSIGHLGYLSLLNESTACVGNSSSGIFEAPALRVPTINIGDRQRGRLLSPSIVNVPAEADAIQEALHRVSKQQFLESVDWDNIPFKVSDAASRIANILSESGLPLD